MCGSIRRHEELGNIFNRYREIVAVYTDEDFNFVDNTATFYILYKFDYHVEELYFAICKVYDNVKVYSVNNKHSQLLKGKELLWQAHKWYK